jgi:hypothetical protein
MMSLVTKRFVALIEWRRSKFKQGASPRRVADSLSGEELAYKDIPKRFYDDVVAFRHCTQERRLAIVSSIFLNSVKKQEEPRKRLRKSEPEPQHLIAVCGYLSQRCSSMKEAREWLDDRLLRCTYPRGFIVDGRVTVVEKNFQGLKRTVLK